MEIEYDHRRYVCTSCDEVVRARAFQMVGEGTYPNGFSVGCECISMDSCPYEMSQAETPDEWRIERESCCTDLEMTDDEAEQVYGDGVADYRCPECGATYLWDGRMVRFPDREPTNDDRPERPLTDL